MINYILDGEPIKTSIIWQPNIKCVSINVGKGQSQEIKNKIIQGVKENKLGLIEFMITEV